MDMSEGPVSAHVAPPYGNFIGWLIPTVRPFYMYAWPAAA